MADEAGGHGAPAAVWFAVVVIIISTIVMGIGLIEWIWPMFWIGTGMFVLGTGGALLVGIMDTVTEFHASSPAKSPTS